eukprot:5507648-Pleurochrysis_carterae.AAC.2
MHEHAHMRLRHTTLTVAAASSRASSRRWRAQVFRADDADITEEDIDTILRSAKNLTAEREGKLKEKAKRELLDFSNAEVNFQEFDGVDYKVQRRTTLAPWKAAPRCATPEATHVADVLSSGDS